MLVKIKDLTPGMMLGRDLMDFDTVLLREGAVLTKQTIKIIRQRSISSVDIIDDGLHTKSSLSVSSGLKALGLTNDVEHREKREALDSLFADIQADDAQMQMLKYCLSGQLEEANDEG